MRNAKPVLPSLLSGRKSRHLLQPPPPAPPPFNPIIWLFRSLVWEINPHSCLKPWDQNPRSQLAHLQWRERSFWGAPRTAWSRRQCRALLPGNGCAAASPSPSCAHPPAESKGRPAASCLPARGAAAGQGCACACPRGEGRPLRRMGKAQSLGQKDKGHTKWCLPQSGRY